MAEYVSKENLQAKLNRKKAEPANKRYTEGWNDAILMVKSMIHSEKAADVATVRHGRWVYPIGMAYNYVCSECGKSIGVIKHNYCPNCGAKMEGGNDD